MKDTTASVDIINYPVRNAFFGDLGLTDKVQETFLRCLEFAISFAVFGTVPLWVLLDAVLKQRNTVAVEILKAMRVDIDQLRDDIMDVVTPPVPPNLPPVIDFSEILQVARRAQTASMARGGDYVSLELLMLSLLQAEDAVTRQLFLKHRVSYSNYARHALSDQEKSSWENEKGE